MARLLIAEDDPEIAMLERDYLEMEGYDVTVVDNGQQAVTEALNGDYSLLLLDLMLPGCSGYDVCRLIRDRIDVPILMVTARTESVDKIRGLGLGADDYIAKPFRARELVSRMRGALRRTSPADNVLTMGDVRLNVTSGAVTRGGTEVFLSALEYRLLLYFLQHKGKLVTREMLRDAIWDSAGEYVSDNALNVYIKRLREKVEADPSDPQIIVTVRGLGYKVGE